MMRVKSEFNHLNEIKKIFPKDLKVIGVGVSAFQRSGLGYILPNYEILSLLETSDLEAIRKICPVTSIEKDLGGQWPQKLNTSSILKLPQVQNWLGERMVSHTRCETCLAGRQGSSHTGYGITAPAINLFVYKAATPLDEIIKDLAARLPARQVKLLSSPGWVRKPLEDKKVFREEAQRAGIKIPRGENLRLEVLTEKKWEAFKQKYGEKLVFQLTDYSTGGGQGTFFIDSKKDFKKFQEFCQSQERKKELHWVNVCERVGGRSASITGCATKYGVVTSVLQTQIMDQPELVGFKGRSGVWLGHDWTMPFSPEAQLNAEKLCQQWGQHIYQKGYKGIFGLDVVVDPPSRKASGGSITAIECNSRYTGAFPVYTMLQLSQREMPLDVWHLLEWLGLDYEMDIKSVQKINRQPKIGSHIIMHNLADQPVKAEKSVKAGVYVVTPRTVARKRQCFETPPRWNMEIKYLRPGFSLLDINSDEEFVLCDRIPNSGQIVKPGERIGKLIFKRRIIDDQGNLLPDIKKTVKEVYENFSLSV